MRRVLYLSFLILVIFWSRIHSQTLYQKAYSYGSTKNDIVGASSIVKINNNRFILGGDVHIYAQTANTFPVVNCIDSLGAIIWTKKYTGFTDGFIVASKLLADGNVIFGGRYSNQAAFFIFKTDANGTVIWAKEIENLLETIIFKALDEDAFGNIYCVADDGTFMSTGGVSTIFKFNSAGSIVWQNKYSNAAGSVYLRSLKTLSSGEIIISGRVQYNGIGHGLLMKMDGNGTISWNKSYTDTTNIDFRELISLPNDEIAIATGFNESEAIVKLDNAGNIVWKKRSTIFNGYSEKIYLSPDSKSIYLGGHHQGTKNAFDLSLSKFSLDGNHLWEKEYGDCNTEYKMSLTASDSTVYIVSSTSSYGAHEASVFLIRTNTSGYTSCYDASITPNYQSFDLSVENYSVTSSVADFIASAIILTESSPSVTGYTICSSLNPVYTAFHASETVICANTCISLFDDNSLMHESYNVDIPLPSMTYEWILPGATFTSGTESQQNPTNVCYNIPGQHNVSLIVKKGCKIDTLLLPNYITVKPASTPTINGDSSFCFGENTILDAGEGFTSYKWLPSGLTTQTITVSEKGEYSVIVSNDCGTDTSETIAIKINPLPTIKIVGDSSICVGDSTMLTARGGAIYLWSTFESDSTITISPSNTSAYTVSGIDTNGCTNIALQSIQVNSAVVANAGVSQTICEGQSVNLSGSGGDSYSWSNGQTTSTITVSPTSKTTYTLTVFKGDCIAKDTVLVNVNPSPKLTVNENFITVLQGTTTVLEAKEGENYQWLPTEGLSCTTCPSPLLTADKNTTYCVTATSSNTCTATKCIDVKVTLVCGELFVPTGFSPNGDNVNDVLEVKINPDCVSEYEFLIFDRWGEKVFEGTSVLDTWDGKFNGKELDNAAFVYHLKVKLKDSTNSIVKKGNVSIIN